MAHETIRGLVNFFGFIIWGDVNELTVYRDKQGKMIVFPKTWPDKPPSTTQIEQRARMTQAAQAWQDIETYWQSQWDLAARKASLCMTGYNMFVHWQLMGDTTAMQAIQRQTGVRIWPLPA